MSGLNGASHRLRQIGRELARRPPEPAAPEPVELSAAAGWLVEPDRSEFLALVARVPYGAGGGWDFGLLGEGDLDRMTELLAVAAVVANEAAEPEHRVRLSMPAAERILAEARARENGGAVLDLTDEEYIVLAFDPDADPDLGLAEQ